jgi:ankyrin repeat protein
MAVAEVLINAGADVNAKGYNGNTPLILAANGGHTGVARLLLNHPNISIHDQVSCSAATYFYVYVYVQCT